MICDVLIITGKDESLGSGHFQRMATLLWRLRTKYGVNAYLFVDPNDGTCPLELKKWLVEKIQPARLIVRDMRDSSAEEIQALKKFGKVCVIDDRGEGRASADIRIDLLPHFEKTHDAVSGSFLYGYNFIQNLEALAGDTIEKKIDIVIYAGYSGEARDYLLTLLPDTCSYCLLGGEKPFIGVKGGSEQSVEGNYARFLCASKAAMSHFGIFLYEAYASGCNIIAVNPTEYHSAISDCAGEELELKNVGIRGSLNITTSKQVISECIQKPRCSIVESGEILKKILLSADNIIEYLLKFL